MQNLKPTELLIARNIALRPQVALTCPALLASVWTTLKAARGQTVNLDRIDTPAHVTDRNPIVVLNIDNDLRKERLRRRIRRHAAQRGYPLASPDNGGGDAA